MIRRLLGLLVGAGAVGWIVARFRERLGQRAPEPVRARDVAAATLGGYAAGYLRGRARGGW